MAVNQPAIDRLKLDEAFGAGTFKPFNECWTVRMDTELLVVDDDTEKVSRFSDDKEEGYKGFAYYQREQSANSPSFYR